MACCCSTTRSGALSLKAIHRRLKTELHRALFAAGVAEGERRARARALAPGPSPPRLRAVDNITGESSSGKDQAEASVLTHKETG